MFEVIFLFVLALIWMVFATVQDLRTREIANWLNFSLIIFALGFRFFYSLFGSNFNFFYQGLIGLAVFFILGNIFYYGRMFAGGDAKQIIALGAIIPISDNFYYNLEYFFIFLFIFLMIGALYSLILSMRFCLKNYWVFKKHFVKSLRNNIRLVYLSLAIAIFLAVLGFYYSIFIILAVIAFLMPYLYLYAKSVDEVAMVHNKKVNDLQEGDWLYNDLMVGKGWVRAKWRGLTAKEILLLKREYRTVKIREGIPFMPAFLISFLIFMYLIFVGLRNPFW